MMIQTLQPMTKQMEVLSRKTKHRMNGLLNGKFTVLLRLSGYATIKIRLGTDHGLSAHYGQYKETLKARRLMLQTKTVYHHRSRASSKDTRGEEVRRIHR